MAGAFEIAPTQPSNRGHLNIVFLHGQPTTVLSSTRICNKQDSLHIERAKYLR